MRDLCAGIWKVPIHIFKNKFNASVKRTCIGILIFFSDSKISIHIILNDIHAGKVKHVETRFKGKFTNIL